MMTGAFVLLVFMDVQAAKHYKSVHGQVSTVNSGKSDSENAAASENPVGEFDAQAVLRPVKDALKIDQAIEEYKAVSGDVKKNAVKETQDSVKAASSQIKKIEIKSDSYYLYFIRYNGGRSELVRVERKSASGKVRIDDLLKALQEGPAVRERGILNAFDSRIKILGAKLERGILEINVSSEFDRMGKRIIQDRLDQLVLTLVQFPEIRGVKLLMDGKQVKSLSGSDIKIDKVIGPPTRKVSSL
jgi:spore germination protein GerM